MTSAAARGASDAACARRSISAMVALAWVWVLGDVARGLGQRVADFLLAAGGGGAGLLPFLAQRGGHAGQRSGPGVQAGLVAGDQVALQGDGGLGRLGGGID